jgi:hypothetical protein
MNIKNLIKNIYETSSPQSARNKIRKYKDDVLNLFNNNYSFKLCVYMILNDIDAPPLCSCGKQCQHDNSTWKKTCGDKKCFSNHQRNKTIESSDKIKKTNLERHGVESFTSSQKFKDKTSQTNIERYGTSIYVESSDFQKKKKDSSLEKYGVDHPMKSDSLKMKPSQTKRKLFDESNPELSIENLSKICNESTPIIDICKSIYGDVFIDSKMFNRVYSIIVNRGLPYLKTKGTSNGEKEVVEYIKTFYDGIIEINSRSVLSSGKEIDIFIPEFNLAIEYNGEYWHSEQRHKVKYNLLDKTLECEDQGIHLLHIYDSEWRHQQKQKIWMSMIQHKMNRTPNRIYARNCKVSDVIDDSFFDENHIQGNTRGSILTLSLIHDGKIVSQMSISKSRFNKNFEYEILRFSVKRNTHVVGGFAKLFNNAKKILNSKSFISYANRRWSQGNVYTSSGEFKLLGNSKPNYVYHKQGRTISRINAQKHKLSKMLENFDSNKSEIENMKDNGYVIVYDCGNLSFGCHSD